MIKTTARRAGPGKETILKFALFSGSAPEWSPKELATKLAQQGWHGVEWRVVDQKEAPEPGFWAGNRATFPLTGFDNAAKEINAITYGAGLEHAGVSGYVAIDDRKNLDILF